MSDIYRDSIFWVEIERIKPNPFQPRREFNKEKLEGLAESIRMYGLLQPLTVTRKETDKEDGGIIVQYELIAGERRLRASKIAGLTQIPVIIRSGEDTDQMKLELAIIENLQREDLNPVDRAKAFHRLSKEFKFTHNEIGKKVGKSREYVTNTLRVLSLPEEVQRHLAEGKIVEGHTRPLLMLNDRPQEQQVLVKEILLKQLTVRESESLARRAAQDKVSKQHKINPTILNLERQLTEKLGTRVQIEQREKGGKVVISFFTPEDLTTLLNTIRYEGEQDGLAETFNTQEKNDPEETVIEETEISIEDTIEPIRDEVKNFSDSEVQVPEEVAQTTQLHDEIKEEMKEEEVTQETEKTHGAQSMTDRFKDFLVGHSLIQDEEVVQHAIEKNESIVEPSPDRPLPEEAPLTQDTQTPLEQLNQEITAESPKTEEKSATQVASEPKEEAQEAQQEEKTKDEEEDLYSIRNFSI